MKNVLFFSTSDYNLEKANAALSRKFKGLSKGMRVFVLARGNGWDVEGYGVKFFLIPKSIKLLMPFWLLRAYRKGRKIIRKYHIDTVVSQSPSFDGYVASILAKKTNTELIVEIHGDFINSVFFYYDFPAPAEFFLRSLFGFFGRVSLERADKIRVISEATNKLAKRFPTHQKIYKFPTFTDIDIFKNEQNVSWQPIILYAGWLYKLKGVQFLIPAFQGLKDKFPDFTLVIVGDGPYRGELERLAKRGGGRIHFVGWKPLEEVEAIMRNCWMCVLPSLSEGLGRVLIEAAMLWKPCIGSNVGGIPEVIHDRVNGYVFEPGNVKELKDKLQLLMGNQELAMSMGQAGRRLVENKFSTARYFEDYIGMVNG